LLRTKHTGGGSTLCTTGHYHMTTRDELGLYQAIGGRPGIHRPPVILQRDTFWLAQLWL
jgi:hypothetical protein